MNGWSWYWLVWLLLGFGVPEGIALARNPRNTLSYQVWNLEGTGPTFMRFVVGAALLWLLLHMVFRLFR